MFAARDKRGPSIYSDVTYEAEESGDAAAVSLREYSLLAVASGALSSVLSDVEDALCMHLLSKTVE